MKKFIILYRGPATKAEDMAPEARNAVMSKWGEWMGKIGAAMIDMGQPMNNEGIALIDNGSNETAPLLNGYSIIQAENIETAKSLTEGHPFLSDKTGKFSVDIYELQPVPKM